MMNMSMQGVSDAVAEDLEQQKELMTKVCMCRMISCSSLI